MSYTSAFCTRSEMVPCKNLPVEGLHLVALDIGYSAVKGFSSTSRFCFPSFVKKITGTMVGAPKPMDIYYQGEDGDIYAVGSMAQMGLTSRDTNDATNTLFGRNRYDTPAFLILARVGLALGLGKADCKEERPLFLQTGLPPAYRKADTPLLKDALGGEHEFSVKIGTGDWRHFSFTLNPSNISVIDQPIGSVYSATKRSDGTTILCDDGQTYIDKQLLVLDGGFGTLDVFSITNRHIDNSNTFNDLGMKAIFEGVSNDVFNLYGKEVHPHTMQRCLADGHISILDRKTRTTTTQDLTEILERNNRKVFETAMAKIEAAYDNLEDFDYLLVTGGTGAAWFDMLQERYKGMSTLHIISGNQNEKMAPIYNNVRGYYIYRAILSQK